jgi:hypothetical protein
VFGDVGGTSSIISSIFTILAAPFSLLYFRIKTLNKLFVAKTSKSSIFTVPKQSVKILKILFNNNYSLAKLE